MTFENKPIKSIQTTFILKLAPYPNVYISKIQIPTSNAIRYLGLILDLRLQYIRLSVLILTFTCVC